MAEDTNLPTAGIVPPPPKRTWKERWNDWTTTSSDDGLSKAIGLGMLLIGIIVILCIWATVAGVRYVAKNLH